MNQSCVIEPVDQAAIAVRVVGREDADAIGVQHLRCSSGEPSITPRGSWPSRALLRDLVGGQAEDEDVVVADLLADLDVGAVERADGQRAVERELHVAGARRLHAGGRDLLGQVGGGNDASRPG